MAVTTSYSFGFVETIDPTLITGRSDATSLANGGVAVVGDHAGHVDSTQFEADGDFQGQTLVITGGDAANTQLTNGNVVILTDIGTDMEFTIVDGNGAVVRAATSIGEGGPDVLDPEVAALAGGGFVVAIQDFFGGTDNDVDIRVYDSGGNLLTNFAVDGTGANDQNPSVAGLADGGFAVAWHRNIGGENDLWYAVYNADGSVRRAPAAFDTFGTFNRNASVVALDSGGFAIAYEDTGWGGASGGDTDISLATFNAAGNNLTLTDITQNASNDTGPSATVLSNGMIAVGYTNDVFGDTDTRVTLVDQNTGAALGTSTFGGSLNNEIDASIARMSNGQVATFHTDATAGDVVGSIRQATRFSTGDGAADTIIGDDLRDVVNGGDGNDTINGGLNADNLFGGNGFDTFVVSGTVEVAGETIDGFADSDRILVTDDRSIDTRLDQTTIVSIEEIEWDAANVSGVAVTVLASQIGGALPSNLFLDFAAVGTPDRFRVEMGTDTGVNLSGFTIQDFFPAGTENDRIIILGDGDNETMVGTVVRDELFGTGGDDKLVGHGGGDYLSGGTGSDTASYSTATTGVIASLSNAAINTGDAAGDTYNSVENLQGTAFNDSLNGTNGANDIRGGAGDDTLKGFNGSDDLLGGEDDDILIGGAGGDFLAGGNGSDTASYLGALAGVTASLANPAINTGDAAGDTYNSVENLFGTNFADNLNGSNGVNNVLNGSGGDDVLKGYTGNDTLTGGGGDDTFAFNTALNAATNVDAITDFVRVDDSFQLDLSFFAGIAQAPGVLLSGYFKNIDLAAVDANDRILYDESTGQIFHDANGSGAGQRTLFATITPNSALAFDDFFVVA